MTGDELRELCSYLELEEKEVKEFARYREIGLEQAAYEYRNMLDRRSRFKYFGKFVKVTLLKDYFGIPEEYSIDKNNYKKQVIEYLKSENNTIRNYHGIKNKAVIEICCLLDISLEHYIQARIELPTNTKALDFVVMSDGCGANAEVKLYLYKGKVGNLREFKPYFTENEIYKELKKLEINSYNKNNIDTVVKNYIKTSGKTKVWEAREREEKARYICELFGLKKNEEAFLELEDKLRGSNYELAIITINDFRYTANIKDIHLLLKTMGGLGKIKLDVANAMIDRVQYKLCELLERRWGMDINQLVDTRKVRSKGLVRPAIVFKDISIEDMIGYENHGLYFMDFRKERFSGKREFVRLDINYGKSDYVSYQEHIKLLKAVRYKVYNMKHLDLYELEELEGNLENLKYKSLTTYDFNCCDKYLKATKQLIDKHKEIVIGLYNKKLINEDTELSEKQLEAIQRYEKEYEISQKLKKDGGRS